ncbi:VirB4 family type IV secretion/conjugal transfer ATPase (plasmid) [Xanthomonas phaseoli pv. manihotis]|uniref:VirB4 family type IV secretion/conjugal transfer ATPase n=1 Tax=Xanthomonas phaseoli TaxID=1985254 RepID=UPI001E41898C|nr:VirB4 family type IV secretion/conjugal transfer ATPase [Xanthomonas phaseoli]UEQ17572.1 VirB4 family type IV secretion/conjugal transfer ATPase [Xanthomonas phaseoli pv. manihotis]
MNAQARYQQQLNGERSISPFIPYSSQVSPDTIVTLEGDYVRTWRLAGLAWETADPEELLQRKEELNTLYRSIASEHVAMWTHILHRKTSDRLVSHFDNEFCRQLDEKYYASFTGYKMMANELYVTLVYRPHPSRIGKLFSKASRRSHAEIIADQRRALRRLDELASQVEASMRRYGGDERRGIEVLRTYDKGGALHSQQLEFLNYLLTGEWQPVRVPQAPLNEYLGNAWVFAGTETIEIRTPVSTRFARCIDFKDYPENTEPGILNMLMYKGFEYVVTQSFSFMPKRDGVDFLDRQEKRLRNTEDGSVSQLVAMAEAKDSLINGEFAMGEYHFSMMVFGDSMDSVRSNTTEAMTTLQNEGFLAALVNTATDAAFYAQLPCNFRFRPRIAGLTSQNFACLAGFHNFRAGKRDGNPWGQALTLLKTPSGQPAYLNFHFSKGDEDNYDQKLLGNTRVIGQSGSGKTVLLNFCMCQAQKYKHNAPMGLCFIFFDKDQGAKATILASGGKYLAVRNGQPTGFNPLQMEPTEANILFLQRLVRSLVSSGGNRVTTEDERRIEHAVRTVMGMPKALRRLSTVLQNITEGSDKEDRENSVAKRLAKWCADDGYGKTGSLAWALDCAHDQIDFTTHTTYGFDGTDFLDNEDVRTPISMYLLHRMESVIDGRRFIYWMDEAWKWVDDDAFSDFAGNKQLTIRKQNGLGVFATQMPSSLLKSKIASQLVQQVATEIYLPNPKADYHEYVDGFKVTEHEYKIIKSMSEDSRLMIVKQGHQSMICRLDLGGMGDELAILSGSSDNNELLDEIIAEVGDDPSQWLPVFHQRRKARVVASKKSN